MAYKMAVTELQARKMRQERRAPQGGADGDEVFDVVWLCSNCGNEMLPQARALTFHPKNFNYCPYCGAAFVKIIGA